MEGVLYLHLSAGALEAVTVDATADSAPPLPTRFSEVKLWIQHGGNNIIDILLCLP